MFYYQSKKITTSFFKQGNSIDCTLLHHIVVHLDLFLEFFIHDTHILDFLLSQKHAGDDVWKRIVKGLKENPLGPSHEERDGIGVRHTPSCRFCIAKAERLPILRDFKIIARFSSLFACPHHAESICPWIFPQQILINQFFSQITFLGLSKRLWFYLSN